MLSDISTGILSEIPAESFLGVPQEFFRSYSRNCTKNNGRILVRICDGLSKEIPGKLSEGQLEELLILAVFFNSEKKKPEWILERIPEEISDTSLVSRKKKIMWNFWINSESYSLEHFLEKFLDGLLEKSAENFPKESFKLAAEIPAEVSDKGTGGILEVFPQKNSMEWWWKYLWKNFW